MATINHMEMTFPTIGQIESIFQCEQTRRKMGTRRKGSKWNGIYPTLG